MNNIRVLYVAVSVLACDLAVLACEYTACFTIILSWSFCNSIHFSLFSYSDTSKMGSVSIKAKLFILRRNLCSFSSTFEHIIVLTLRENNA